MDQTSDRRRLLGGDLAGSRASHATEGLRFLGTYQIAEGGGLSSRELHAAVFDRAIEGSTGLVSGVFERFAA